MGEQEESSARTPRPHPNTHGQFFPVPPPISLPRTLPLQLGWGGLPAPCGCVAAGVHRRGGGCGAGCVGTWAGRGKLGVEVSMLSLVLSSCQRRGHEQALRARPGSSHPAAPVSPQHLSPGTDAGACGAGAVGIAEAAFEEGSGPAACFGHQGGSWRTTLSLLPSRAQGQRGSVGRTGLSDQPHVTFVGGKMSAGDLLLAICLHCLRQWGFWVEGLDGSEGQHKSCLRSTEHPPSEVLWAKPRRFSALGLYRGRPTGRCSTRVVGHWTLQTLRFPP